MQRILFTVFLFVLSTTSFGEEKYVNADIERVEVCDAATKMIFIYLSNTFGDTPSTSNGCSNDKVLPYVRISMEEDLAVNNAMYSLALAMYSVGNKVRIRYEDSDSQNHVVSIAPL